METPESLNLENPAVDCLRRQLADHYETDPIATHQKVYDFAQQLKTKYPDYADHILYHVLVGSTPRPGTKQFDFPGEDSVERFINQLK